MRHHAPLDAPDCNCFSFRFIFSRPRDPVFATPPFFIASYRLTILLIGLCVYLATYIIQHIAVYNCHHFHTIHFNISRSPPWFPPLPDSCLYFPTALTFPWFHPPRISFSTPSDPLLSFHNPCLLRLLPRVPLYNRHPSLSHCLSSLRLVFPISCNQCRAPDK